MCAYHNSQHKNNWNICNWVFMHKQTTLACKRVDRTKSYISRSNVHWRIKGIWCWWITFCGGTNSVKTCKGGERCCEGKTTIHISVVKSTANHKVADNGQSTLKGDGNATTWSGSNGEKKLSNPRQNYTFGERY
jgi:hypothetical protein